MPAQEARVGITTCKKGGDEMIALKACGVHGGETDAVGIECPILLARQMRGFFRTETFKFGSEELWLGWWTNPVANHEIL